MPHRGQPRTIASRLKADVGHLSGIWKLRRSSIEVCLGSQTNNVNQPGETMYVSTADQRSTRIHLFVRLSDLILSAGTLQSASEIPKDRKNKSMSIQHQSL